MPTEPLPLPIVPAPDPVDPDWAPLLARGAQPMAGTPAAAPLRSRLLQRVADARSRSDALHTVRLAQQPAAEVAPGVTMRTLYRADAVAARRAGEPEHTAVLDLAAGASVPSAHAAWRREWLLLQGAASLGALALGPRDYHLTPPGDGPPLVAGPAGARLFLREARHVPAGLPAPLTVHDAMAGWPEFAPGIRRRVLWHHGGEAALLYLTQPGASVPTHTHGHDEECLMVQGELFLDDVLLREGDYQLAPRGSGHHVTETDTGVLLYAHGDLDLQFVD